ncbi:MAG: pseudouridine synthase [Candidatus Krumholzibacteriia bacterium]
MTPDDRRRRRPRAAAGPTGSPGEPAATDLRLNRLLARAGLGSRRAVETLITSGRVRVDDEVVTDLGRRVDPRRQRVSVDREPVELPQDFRVYAFHKPKGVVSTLKPQGGQSGLAEFRDAAGLPPRFTPVGRLDADTSGLLLWTDDGDLGQALQRPSTGVWKRYRVVCQRPLGENDARRLTRGELELDGRRLRPCRLHVDAPGDGRHWLLDLHEGRNRQIRRMFAAVGNRVVSLEREAVGPVELGRLHEGGFRRLTAAEEAALRSAAGVARPGRGDPGADERARRDRAGR